MADLFTSSKGPGVIGLVLGMIVLGGFALLGMAVFDGRFNGEEADRQGKEFHRNNERIARLKKQIVLSEGQREDFKRYREVAGELKRSKDRHDRLKGEIESAEADSERLSAEWEEYKGQYRAAAKRRIVGAKFGTLTTADGKSYDKVRVTGINALEMTFVHQNGASRVKLALLPEEIRDQLQIGEAEQRALAGRRDEAREREILKGKIRALTAKIQQIRDYNERVRRDILKNNKQRALNEVGIDQRRAKAQAEREQYLADKAAGRSSRADERAEAALTGAAALERKNTGLEAKNAELRRDIATQETRIATIEKNIETLRGELERRIAGTPPEK